MPLIERKVVGEVDIGPAAPTPPTPPVPVEYEEILRRHEEIRREIDTKARIGECVTIPELVTATGLDESTISAHWKILKGDLYASETDDGENFRICSRDALNRLYRMLGDIVFHER